MRRSAERTWQQRARRADQAVDLPADVTADDLDPAVRRALRGLSGVTADLVARHLVAAGALVDEDPERAWQHAKAARALAGRVGAVREAVGISAYLAGHFAEALSELRTARRITGSDEHLPVMADAERGLGRPEKALAIARDAVTAKLDNAARVELAIVESGARRDLGETGAAVLVLRELGAESSRGRPWTARLRYAYAAALEDNAELTKAREWFLSAQEADVEGETDADERAEALLTGGRSAATLPDLD